MSDALPTPIFDTQIVAKVCGYGDSISYNRLVADITGVQLDKTSQHTDWSIRPLSQKQLDYAIADVNASARKYIHTCRWNFKNEIEHHG